MTFISPLKTEYRYGIEFIELLGLIQIECSAQFYVDRSHISYDPIWFGVVFCINTQIGLITPPMGTDLFAVKTIFNIPTIDIIKGVAPFMGFEVVFWGIVSAFPAVSPWLPSLMVGK
jgi:TRAP-type C4-dicarboxylate transport system permease large subunit